MRPLLLFIMLSAIAASQPFPESMTRLSVRLQSPDVPEQSFAAKPKLMYRAGTRYCRTDELPDPENGIHGLMIINEPDVWMVNLLNRTARHFVDPGPTFNCHLAMFASGRAKSGSNGRDPLLELEFGQEVAYFMGKRAAPKEGPVHEGKPSTLYAVEAGDSHCCPN